jgi:hypothetical protein
MADDAQDPTLERAICALEQTIDDLKQRVQKPYQFRFVSPAQARPYAVAYANWERNGRLGPQPVGSAADVRAVIYDLASSASELAAFPKIASVSATELAQTAVERLKAGDFIISYTVLRGFIERTAHALAQSVTVLETTRLDGPPTPVWELSEIISKSLYGTGLDWQVLTKVDFRQTPAKETKYVKKDDTANMKSDRIGQAVNKLELRVPGARLVYEILCEFLHPNVGDLWSTTLTGKVLVDDHGARHLVGARRARSCTVELLLRTSLIASRVVGRKRPTLANTAYGALDRHVALTNCEQTPNERFAARWMMQNTSHAVMAQRTEPNDSPDDFPTPPWATRALLEHILGNKQTLATMICLEPACGAGHMATVLKEYFRQVQCSDAYEYGYGQRRDFISSPYETAAFDWVITNPPFRLAEDFVLQGLRVARHGVAILARTVFLESVGRYTGIFRNNPPTKFAQFTERVPMVKGRLDSKATTATGYAWLVWEKNVVGLPRLMWVPPCRRQLERSGDYASLAS